ncbi:MAG: HAMP domain-containing protein, partial [Planctomycetes bacterium]|nr:HAMP domain-containing protein [Planctomycetota bacterium]
MTLRLIGLMSVVLFISLSAFSFLLHGSQGAIMEEVSDTVSTVGQKTLQVVGLPEPRSVATASRVEARVEAGPAEEGSAAAEGAERSLAFRFALPRKGGVGVGATAEPRESAVLLFEVEGPVAAAPDEEEAAPPRSLPLPEEIEAVLARGVWNATFSTVVLVSEGVTTEASQGEVMARIPVTRHVWEPVEGDLRLEATVAAGAGGGEAAEQAQGATAPVERRLAVYHEDLTFDVPVHEYESIFAAIRKRMLVLFLGVLGVGTVLSAGLARRFTRPIRELDRGLHRLSSGDLDVAVEVKGKDEVARLGGAFNEMTRRLRASRERAREVARKEKLSSLGRLAAGVAHDVRNPLHSINLTLQHLQETCAPEAPAACAEFARSLDVIRAEIHRLDRLVGNFLRFARSDRLERAPVHLGDLLRETAQLVATEAERRGIAVQVDAAPDLPAIEANVESLRSALLNLVLNSFEAMPGGGALTLRALACGEDTRVEVQDTGAGIAEEDRERVFEFGF